jgi:hypothetical protein
MLLLLLLLLFLQQLLQHLPLRLLQLFFREMGHQHRCFSAVKARPSRGCLKPSQGVQPMPEA